MSAKYQGKASRDSPDNAICICPFIALPKPSFHYPASNFATIAIQHEWSCVALDAEQRARAR